MTAAFGSDPMHAAWDDVLQAAFGNAADNPRNVLADQAWPGAQRVVLDGELLPNPPDATPQLHAAPQSHAERTVGRYRIIAELARGGGGVVLHAHDLDLRRDVAIKVLAENHKDPLAWQRFFAEAQLGGQLQHPGIVPVYELGLDRSRRPFFVMKLVQGQTLAAILQAAERTARDSHALLETFLQLCETVAYAHQRGVIHRDLKPANIMVGAFGEIQVMDWGLAKVRPAVGQAIAAQTRLELHPPSTIRSAEQQAVSLSGSVFGTPAYMSPEQAAGNPSCVTPRSDVFSLGAILCEILTGSAPYGEAAEVTVAVAAAADLDAADRRLRGCGASLELVRIASSCLQLRPEDRPADAGELAAQLVALRVGVEQRLRAAQRQSAAAEARADAERRARHLQLLLAGVVVLLLLLVASGFWFYREAAHQRREQADLAVTNLVTQAEQYARQQQWTAMQASLQQAQERSLAGVSASVGERLHQQSERLQQERLRADQHAVQLERQAALTERFLSLLAPHAEAPLATREEFLAAFEAAGIPVWTLPPAQVAERILTESLALREVLVRVLDHWAMQDPQARQQQRLFAIAQGVDQSVVRRQLRDAVGARDVVRLRMLAAEHEVVADSATAVELLGAGLAQLEDRESALAVLRAGCERYPGSFWLNVRLAAVLMGGDLAGPRKPVGMTDAEQAEAVLHARIARSLQADIAFSHQFLAWTLQQQSELQAAHAVLAEAVQRFPSAVGLRIDRAAVALELGQRDLAVAEIRWVLAREPGQPRARFMVQRLRALGHWPLSTAPHVELERLRGALADEPARLDLHLDLIQCNLDVGEDEAALQAALLARSFGRHSTELRVLLVRCLVRLGRYAEARDELQQARGRLVVALRQEREELDRVQLAEAALATFLASGALSGNAELDRTVALACQQQGKVQAAARAFLLLGTDALLERAGPIHLQAAGRLAAVALVQSAQRGVAQVDPRAARHLALTLLRHRLQRARQLAPEQVGAVGRMRLALWHWRHDVRLAGVREPFALVAMPPAEQNAWRDAWDDVDRWLSR